VETELNPQVRFGADVMNRIRAALNGDDLTAVIRETLGAMVTRLSRGREQEIAEIVLVGNTVMHHLFSGCDVEPLATHRLHRGIWANRASSRTSWAGICGRIAGFALRIASVALSALTFWPASLPRHGRERQPGGAC